MEERAIKFEGKVTLIDEEAREMLSMLDTRITTINERTKNHTWQIGELKNKIKELEKK